MQEEQDRLMTLMGTGAALATATGVAGKQSSDGDAVAGLSEGPDGIIKEAGSASATEEAFILSLASCTVHEERQDPTALTATPEQQRQEPPAPIPQKGSAQLAACVSSRLSQASWAVRISRLPPSLLESTADSPGLVLLLFGLFVRAHMLVTAGYDLLLWTSTCLPLPLPVTPCDVSKRLYAY